MLPPDLREVAWKSLFGLCVVLLALGLVARYVVHARARTAARIAFLEDQALRVHAQERDELARELHDVVAHQLSIASLQVMGHRDSEDVVELRDALDRIDDATRAALSELRLLVGVLRSHDDAGDGFGLLGLRERVELTGGTFEAGERDGRWLVEAVLPRA